MSPLRESVIGLFSPANQVKSRQELISMRRDPRCQPHLEWMVLSGSKFDFHIHASAVVLSRCAKMLGKGGVVLVISNSTVKIDVIYSNVFNVNIPIHSSGR